ncbi:septal ring lytic transglycosylase RlpA family lipoprotein [Flavobacterium aquariorum]|uniref:Probable endolytic peptidoglycan transglycosylase RlpA n=1 Tax=Flavobacterium aquariorum TaxID=2217670 RepID=A0A2W7TYP6_9FLAO|nr:septal ring lytic transglycosylase RlpA family protein [Flavobacterium aquariorum]PZX95158.1 septal ring lytic transglycosylase RlpA family lipoprotein [Flavobacterium aquariorum]
MKKIITLLFILANFGLVSGQSAIINSKKFSINKDTVKKTTKVVEKEFTPVTIAPDTTAVETGKFVFFKKNAHASYYHDKFNGKRTASGKRFDNQKLTAAHRKFPFGTKLKITNEANGKSVIVEVIDRGPFARGREIDLSKKAFMDITSSKSSGAVIVKIEELRK